MMPTGSVYILETLEMVKHLYWAEIYETAQSVTKTGGIDHCRKLIAYINIRIDQLPKLAQYRSLLLNLKFLPVLTKPVNEYLLPRKGFSSLRSSRFCAPNEVFLPKNAMLVGSSCLIPNTSDESGCKKMNAEVKTLLGFSSCRLEDEFVIQQLCEAIKI